jgi:prephenate dehydratase
VTELVLLGVVAVLAGLHAFGQVRQVVERKHWDAERRSYVAAALAAQSSNQAAAAVVRPKAERPEPPAPRPVQLDL